MAIRNLHPAPSHARGFLRRDLLRLPLREKLRLARLAATGVLGASVSESAPSQGPLPLPALTQRRMRWILLLRGIYDSNELGTKAMARSAERLRRRLEREAQPREAVQVPRTTWADCPPAEFHARYVRPQQPVVVVDGAPTRTREWSVDWLVERYGKRTAALVDRQGTTYEGPIHDLVSGTAPTGGPYYMHNNERFFVDDPERREDLDIPFLAGAVHRPEPSIVSLFASVQPGTGSIMHCAGNMNTFLLLEGRKRWTLVDPSYFLLTYPYLSHTNNFQLSLVEDAEEFEALPYFRYCPRYVVDLEPGDCLYIPTWWYHSIRNLEARTLAVAIRWAAPLAGEACTNALFRFLHLAAPRITPGTKGIHQDSTERIGTGVAREVWGLAT